MDEILKMLAGHTGISQDTARNGLGAIVSFLKEHLPSGLSGDLMKSLPDAHGLVEAFEKIASGGGGSLMTAVTGLASKVFGEGAGDVSKLLGMLQKAGLSMEQIESFVPKVIETIQKHIPADLFAKILEALPALKSAGGKA